MILSLRKKKKGQKPSQSGIEDRRIDKIQLRMSAATPYFYAAGTAAWAAAARRYGAEQAVLGGNVVWYGLAAMYFGVLNKKSVFWMIPKREWSNQLLIKSLANAMGFLGSINMALVALSAMVLLARRGSERLFKRAEERRVLFLALAVGHFSQVGAQNFNPPGILRYIYWMDLAQGLANVHCAAVAEDDGT